MILHILNSTSQKALNNLESVINHNDALILIEDAIYLPYFYTDLLKPFKEFSIYLLDSDAKARGINQELNCDIFSFVLADYAQFVILCCQYDKTISWCK
ncbi:MAG: hypothetical protein EP298_05790 [Gammaproteobacteria bacterium]|nr:MAG: hypothetical protein EP298_05790 [Gammaproteobacteria bacterium]UTW41433.1 hypothetical protein KFE69_07880 [bacterium SCSIO 12844]